MINTKGFLLLLCTLVLSLTAKSQVDKDLQIKIDSLFHQWDHDDSPGASIGIIKDGKLIYTQGYGSANLDYQISLDADSKFYIASTAKQFTAACIALLSLEGKINLDDDIRKYIPEIPDYGKTISIRHLVHHTSGLRDYLGLMFLSGKSFEDYFNIEDGIQSLSRQEAPNFSPGEEHLYSNSGYILMAEIVNRVSGMTIRQYADQKIFQPLGMNNTFFNDDHNQITPNRVISYRYAGKDTLKRFVQNFDALGDGNLLTTVNDLYLWDQNFYHKQVGGQAFVNLMLQKGVLNNGEELDYAFGLGHGKYQGLPTISHGGGMLGFRTQFIRFPEQQFSVIVLGNIANFDPNQKVYQIADLFLEAHFEVEEEAVNSTVETKSKTVKLSKKKLEVFTGKYIIQPGVELVISVKEDSLQILQSWDNSSYPLIPTGDHSFRLEDDPNVLFAFSEKRNGKTELLTVHNGGNKTICKRKYEVSLSDVNMNEFVGNFYSHELHTTYRIRLQDDQALQLIQEGNEPSPLTLHQKDELLANNMGLLLRFNREGDKIVGFALDAGRVKNVKFVLE